MSPARLFVLIALTAVLAGCASAARQQARNFQCPGGSVIDVRFDDGGNTATVFAQDFTAKVTRVPDVPANRYSNADTELLVVAKTITLTRAGTVLGKDCQLADERPWAQRFY